MRYANWFKCMRKKAGYTQAEVAKRIKISRKAVSRWELGETRPNYETTEQLFELYECSEQEILDFIAPCTQKKESHEE